MNDNSNNIIYPKPPCIDVKSDCCELMDDIWIIDFILTDILVNFERGEVKNVNKLISDRLPNALGYIRRLHDSLEQYYDKHIYDGPEEDNYSDLKYKHDKEKWIELRKQAYNVSHKLENDIRKKYIQLINHNKENNKYLNSKDITNKKNKYDFIIFKENG